MTDFTVKPTLDQQGQRIHCEDYRLSCHIAPSGRTYRSHAATIYK